MQVFLVTATAADRPVVQQLLGSVDIAAMTVDDVPTAGPWVDGLAATLASCDAVAAVPFGSAMASVLRVIGAAARLGKALIVLLPAGADQAKLPFSLRGAHIVDLAGEPETTAKRVLQLVEDAHHTAAAGSPRRPRIDASAGQTTLPALLTAAGTLTGDAVRLADRVDPPTFVASYEAWSFPDGVIGSWGTLRFTVDDLAHALFVTGRSPGDRMRYGTASIWEWLHRAALIPAYLRRHHTGRLVRSRLALELDRSELVGISYALGQAVTAVFCRNELAVTHLMHIDRYANHYGIAYGATRKRADMFGRAPGGWVVAEAKGRSRGMEAALIAKLREQKRSITAIGGERPWLALGCVASFPDDAPGMRVHAVDPVADAVEPIEIPATIDDYLAAYYAPFVLAIDMGEPVARDDYTVAARFISFGVTVRMWAGVYTRVQQALGGLLDGLFDDLQPMLDEALSRPIGLLSDGTTVETDWTDMTGNSDGVA